MLYYLVDKGIKFHHRHAPKLTTERLQIDTALSTIPQSIKIINNNEKLGWISNLSAVKNLFSLRSLRIMSRCGFFFDRTR